MEAAEVEAVGGAEAAAATAVVAMAVAEAAGVATAAVDLAAAATAAVDLAEAVTAEEAGAGAAGAGVEPCASPPSCRRAPCQP